MESFTITCTTCQQRLKVRDDSAVGEIQICPKCGSMVLVEHPTTDSASDVAEPPLSPELATPPPAEESIDSPPADSAPIGDEAAAELAASMADTADDILPPPIPASTEDESTGVDESPLADDGAASEPVLPTADWTSEASRRRQQLLLIGGAAIVGAVLAIGVFAFIVSRAFQSPDVDPPVSTPDTSTETAAAQPSDDETDVTAAEPDDVGPQDPIDQVVSPEPVEGPSPEDTSLPPSEEPQDPVPPTEKEMPSEPPPAEAPPTDQSAKPKVVEQPEAAPDTTNASSGLSDTLDQFAPFIDPDAFNKSPPETEPTEFREPELDPDEPDQDDVAVPRPDPRQVDVAQRLNDPILGIELNDGSLKHFVRLMMSFSTIPMTLDPDALALVGESPNSSVSIKQADTTVEQTLAGVLTPRRLAAVTVGEQIVITRPNPAGGQLRTFEHPVGDLVGSDPVALSQLAQRIVQMIEPGSWDGQGGDGEIGQAMPALAIRHHDTILFRAIVFCERLRAARGLPPQSNFGRTPNFDRTLFDLKPRFSRPAAQLEKPVTLNHFEPTSFIRITDQLSDASALDILIDWQAIAELGWNPDAMTTIRANGEPLGDVLAQLLQPMGLTFRVINASCIQITSPSALETRLEVEFYPCRDLLTEDMPANLFEALVRQKLGVEAMEQVAASLYIDQPSGHLIAALPQPLHRKLADALKAWRNAAP